MTAESIKAGWRITTLILVCILLFELLGLLAPLLLGLPLSVLGLGRFAIEVWLCWNVYQGKPWARVVLGVLLLLAAIQLLLSGWSVAVGLGVIGLIFAVALFAVPQVNAYMEYAEQQ